MSGKSEKRGDGSTSRDISGSPYLPLVEKSDRAREKLMFCKKRTTERREGSKFRGERAQKRKERGNPAMGLTGKTATNVGEGRTLGVAGPFPRVRFRRIREKGVQRGRERGT